MEVSKPLATVLTAGALVLGVAGGAALNMNRDAAQSPTPVVSASPSPTVSPSASVSPSPASASPVTVNGAKTAVKTYGQSGLLEVTGEVTNQDRMAHGAALSATLYDKSGKVVGTGTGVVSGIEPGKTATFSIVSQDFIDGTSVTAKVTVNGTL